MLEKRQQVLKITTGSSALDQLLGGGVESCAITGRPVVSHAPAVVGKQLVCVPR